MENKKSTIPIMAYKDETGYHTMYTINYITRMKKGLVDEVAKLTHGSEDGETTVCGKHLDSRWFITNNTFDGIITCKECIKIIKNKLLEMKHEL